MCHDVNIAGYFDVVATDPITDAAAADADDVLVITVVVIVPIVFVLAVEKEFAEQMWMLMVHR